MPLTERQAALLALLAALAPEQTLTVKQLCGAAGLSESRTRSMIGTLAESGLASSIGRNPVGWRITDRGRALLMAPRYREYLPRRETPNGSDGG